MSYDNNNVFAKILRGEIPCKKVHEDDFALAFHDIAPQAKIHVLVIPKGPYVSYDHFAAAASADEIVDFTRAVGEVCRMTGVQQDGFRAITNAGAHGLQEVPHMHVHVLGGRPLGRLLDPEA